MEVKAYITNLGKYNEGFLIGDWVTFPITIENYRDVMERIGISRWYEEWFITDYDIDIPEIASLLGEYECLEKLNYLAGRLKEMNAEEIKKFEIILHYGMEDIKNVDDLINLTYNCGCYSFIPGIETEYDLGHYYVHDTGIYDLSNLGALVGYIDYKRYGRDIVVVDSGVFAKGGYLYANKESWREVFNGDRAEIPLKYRVFEWDKPEVETQLTGKEKAYER